jgi:heat shock protein HtpX
MWINWLKSILLLGLLSGLLLLMGSLLGGTTGLHIALFLALIMNGIAFFFSDKIVLHLYGAKPLDKTQYHSIYSTVEELAHSMKLPMPKLWLINTPMANAFATGRSPSHASVAVTTGILDILEPHELRGVLAHELSHIKNRDILIATIAAVLATAIGYVAQMIQHAAFWGTLHGSSSQGNKNRGNPLLLFVVALIMPLAAMLIQLALSRSREYMADESGAHYSHDPLALASALDKLQRHIPEAHLKKQTAAEYAGTAPLFIVYPFASNGWTSLFSTHPPMKARIARLHEIYKRMTGTRW